MTLRPIGFVSHLVWKHLWMTLTWCFSAYSPCDVMSTMHASPADAVRIFKDVEARKALTMHWG